MVSFIRWGDPCVGTVKDSTETKKLMNNRGPRTSPPPPRQDQESLSTHVLCPASFPGWPSGSPSGWMLIAGSSEVCWLLCQERPGAAGTELFKLRWIWIECLCVLYHTSLLQRVCLDWSEYLSRDCSVFYRIWGVVPLCLDYPLTMSGLSSHGCLWTPVTLSLGLPLTSLQYREPGTGSQETWAPHLACGVTLDKPVRTRTYKIKWSPKWSSNCSVVP